MAKRQNGLTLSDMVRGIQYCVNSSAEIAEQHYVKTLEKFFHPDGTPITQKIRLNHDVQLDLPLICMSSHSCLDFEEMRIKTQLKISDVQQKTVETDFSYGAENYEFTRGSLSVSLGDIQNRNRENSLAEIEMVFKRKDPPEALSRLIDHLNNMLQLKNIYKGEESA